MGEQWYDKQSVTLQVRSSEGKRGKGRREKNRVENTQKMVKAV